MLRNIRKEWTAYLFLFPSLLQFAVLMVFPVIFSFYLSFHEWNILEPAKPFVGLDNYTRLLNDARVRQAIVNTLYYTVVSVPLTLFCGLLVALLLNNQIRGRGIFRAMYYLPVVTSAVAVAVVWKWIFNGDFGLINYYLIQAGLIGEPIRWLTTPSLAMPAVIIVSIWGGVGGCMIIYLAGLQAIPEEIYDAARVDGAGPIRTLFSITIPLLGPATFFLLITSIIGAFQQFGLPFLLTAGGPAGRTTTIAYYLYQSAFKNFEMGYAAAMSYVLFAMIFVFTLLHMRFAYRDINY
ncbi:MAG: carbohydrate ABC transporter permease [Roseiflexaceae bacterium]